MRLKKYFYNVKHSNAKQPMIYVRDMNETQNQLADRLIQAATQVQAGAQYEHYKKLIYKVLHVALREEDNEPVVVYQAQYGAHVIWVRPVKNWLEMVEVDGKTVPRFKKL